MTNGNFDLARKWIEATSGSAAVANQARVIGRKQGWGTLRHNVSIDDTPLCLNGKVFDHGLGTHADSEILVELPSPGARFHAYVGVDDNAKTRGAAKPLEMVFSVEVDGDIVWTSKSLMCGDMAEIDVDLAGNRQFLLKVREIHGNMVYAHADWADARVILEDGSPICISKDSLPYGPPISFRYNGQSSQDLLPKWNKSYKADVDDDGVTHHCATYQDPETGLQCIVEMKEYADFPAMEWVVRFKNTGFTDTPILEDVQALDINWASSSKEIVLHRSQGTYAQVDDFLYRTDILYRHETVPQSQSISMVAGGGRSSQCWLPFFNVQTGNEGVITAIGWTGEWAADFLCNGETIVNIRAGMANTHLKLLPGEQIRTPSIMLLFWQGEPLDGNNLLRQFLLEYHTPKIDGKPALGPICSTAWGGMRTPSHLARIKSYQEHYLPYDCYWVDAGWYGVDNTESPDVFNGDWGEQAGNWVVNQYRFPEGLRPISDAAHAAGLKFLLWFEPERAIPGTQLPTNHPDWFLTNPANASTLLLNLGNPDARQWVTDMISNYVTDLNLDWYRQDFNMGPLSYWQGADAPDRQGITEIRHIEGLYEFWDELRRRHPNLMIDNCASAGRRLDLEMIGRSICLWSSDYQCFPQARATAAQIQLMGLSCWLPSHAIGTLWAPPGDTYAYRSSMSVGIADQTHMCDKDTPAEDYPWDWHRARLEEQKRIRPYFYGDYYPLTPCSASPEVWAAYSMHQPDVNEGFVMAFRREDSPFDHASFRLKGLDVEMTYEFEDADTQSTWKEAGRDLVEKGLSVTIEDVRQSRLIYYRACGPK